MNRFISLFVTLLLMLLWIGGGWGSQDERVILLGTLIGMLVWVGLWKSRRLVFPTYFLAGCVFVGFLGLSLLWSKDATNSLKYVLLTGSGILWWVIGRSLNRSVRFSSSVVVSILGAGAVFTILWLIDSLLFKLPVGPTSLITEASVYKNHNHLGDWWMIMLMLVFPQVGNIKEWKWVWILPGVVMTGLLRSRSAITGLIIGGEYTFWINRHMARYKPVWRVMIVVLVIMMVGMGIGKGTLEARDYYVQAVAGWSHTPWGVGLGNFGLISGDVQYQWWGRSHFASVVHNIFLEWTAGIGWLGLAGWVWLGLTAWKLGKKTSGNVTIWRGVFWALLPNLFFDATYFIPSIWWVFCLVMGLAERTEA